MFKKSTRRTFLAALGGLFAAGPVAAAAQHRHGGNQGDKSGGKGMKKHSEMMEQDHMGPEFAWRDPKILISPPPPTMGRQMGQVHTLNVSPLGYEMDGNVKVFKIIAQPVEHFLSDGNDKPSWDIIHKNIRYADSMKHHYPQRALLWGYNGGMPGPTIECFEGDTIRVILKNELPEPTSIHWHGLEVPNEMDGAGGTTEPVTLPGGIRIYQFKLHQTGTYMYHTGFNMMKQDGLGMGGFVVIHPKAYIYQIHKDVAIMLQAFALAPGNDFPNLTTMDFNWFTFNGKTAPDIELITVKQGQRVRLRFGNLTMSSHPIHLHGYTWKVVGTEGGPIPEADFTKLEKQLGRSGDYQMLWEQSEKDEEKIKGLVIQALEGGLTRNEAVSVALLNNRMLQSAFEEIGIAKSDLIQAGLYSNPNLGAIFRFPTKGDESGTNIELGALLSASNLWQIPLKRKVEEARFNRVTLEVGDLILKTRHDTQAAYNRTHFLLKTKKSTEDLLLSFKSLTKAIERRRQFGYMTDLDIYLAGNAEAEAKIEFAGIEMEYAKAVTRLARILGLGNKINEILVIENLPMLPHEYPSVEEAVESALERRIDLKLNKIRLTEAERQLALQKARKIRDVQLGLNWEKETSGNEAIGPEMVIEVPLFDQNQAQIARAEYEIRLARKKIQAKEGQIREQIIADLEEIKYLKKKLEIFEKQIIPLRHKALDYSQKWGMKMQLSRVIVLDVRKDLLASQLELLQIRLALNQAVNGLEYHMGGSI